MIQRYHNEPVGLRVTPEPGDYLKLHDRILPDGSEHRGSRRELVGPGLQGGLWQGVQGRAGQRCKERRVRPERGGRAGP